MNVIPDFEGLHEVEFLNGVVKEINIDGPVYDVRAQPLFLLATDGTAYNYQLVLSTRKKVD